MAEEPKEVPKVEAETKNEEAQEKGKEQKEGETCLFIYHPHELWLKGKNRPVFERQLASNLRKQLVAAGVTDFKVHQIQCEMYVSAPISFVPTIYEVSKKIFGVAKYSRCYKTVRDVEVLKQSITEYVKSLLAKGPIASFKVDTSRVDKRYPVKSMDMSKDIGALIHDTFGIPVNLKQPHTKFNIEIQNDAFYYYTERLEGIGGLPVNTSGKVGVLLSGGFDSPVAAWSIMRRGCAPIYIHFHSAPYGEWRSSVTKIRKIVGPLATWGGPTNFYCVPIGELQRQIALKAPPKLRITLYRRFMVRIAAEICKKNKAIALATGDNLGQVASQTIESMTTIQSVISPMLILRPLLSDSKDEIIQKAAKIGTKDISILPAGDCCSHMLPKSVATMPSIEEATAGEKDLDVKELVNKALQEMQIIDINEPWNEEAPEGEEPAACPLTFQE
jgi:thiamine biosynthesis protein ThiI